MLKKVFSLLVVLVLGISTYAQASDTKIAVVDVQTVLSKSKELNELKKEQDNRRKEMAKFIKNASESIKKEQDVKKKEALAKKYDKELQAKQEANAKVYKTKIETIDKKIADAINAQAKSQGYDFVFRKEVLLYGADDITESVVKVVK